MSTILPRVVIVVFFSIVITGDNIVVIGFAIVIKNVVVVIEITVIDDSISARAVIFLALILFWVMHIIGNSKLSKIHISW